MLELKNAFKEGFEMGDEDAEHLANKVGPIFRKIGYIIGSTLKYCFEKIKSFFNHFH